MKQLSTMLSSCCSMATGVRLIILGQNYCHARARKDNMLKFLPRWQKQFLVETLIETKDQKPLMASLQKQGNPPKGTCMIRLLETVSYNQARRSGDRWTIVRRLRHVKFIFGATEPIIPCRLDKIHGPQERPAAIFRTHLSTSYFSKPKSRLRPAITIKFKN